MSRLPDTDMPRPQTGIARPRVLYVVSEDWYFLSHRLPMARAARDAGFEVHVATKVTDGAAAIEAERFILHPIPFARGRLSPLAAWATISALRRIHRMAAPAVVHHVSVQPAMLGSLAALGRSVASVNALTGLGFTFISKKPSARFLKPVLRILFRLLLGRLHTVALVQNPDDRAALMQLGIREGAIVMIQGSGVDTDRLSVLPEPAGAVTAAFVGRLLDDKGIRPLVAAHRILRERGGQQNLLIAGTPDPANPESVTLAEAQSWAAEPGIIWLGHVNDIAELWAKAHIAVLPSRREGLPLSLLEAAACGRPLVATDVPGCREIAVHDETGLLIPVDDAPALAEAIARLAAAPQLRARFGAAARRRVMEKFSAAMVGQQTVELYRRLLADKAVSLARTA